MVYSFLDRFGRFAKEFGIVFGPGAGPGIVSGEVDLVFRNVSKLSSLPGYESVKRDNAVFLIGKKKKPIAVAQNPQLSLRQFIVGVEQLACRVYAGLIEQQTGTTLECLPPKQKAIASAAAMEVLIKKKLFPTADQLGEP